MLDIAVNYAGIITLSGFGLLSVIAIVFTTWNFLHDVWCLVFHDYEPRKFITMTPFGIGSSYEYYGIFCVRCDRLVRFISKSKYYEMKNNGNNS